MLGSNRSVRRGGTGSSARRTLASPQRFSVGKLAVLLARWRAINGMLSKKESKSELSLSSPLVSHSHTSQPARLESCRRLAGRHVIWNGAMAVSQTAVSTVYVCSGEERACLEHRRECSHEQRPGVSRGGTCSSMRTSVANARGSLPTSDPPTRSDRIAEASRCREIIWGDTSRKRA